MRKTQIIVWLLFGTLLAGCALPAQSTPSESTQAETEAAEVEELRISKNPDKMMYLVGEDFDPTGMQVDVVYSDGTVEENVEYTLEEDKNMSLASLGVKILSHGKGMYLKLDMRLPGNVDTYAVENFPTLADSPIRGNTYFWLGSSVTVGASAMNESMADFFGKKYDCLCIKEAVSGTTLANSDDTSYVARLEKYLADPERAEKLDGFICQLSTNDQKTPEKFGVVTGKDFVNPQDFDTETTFGALEYIFARVKQIWDCPIYVYTNPPTGQESYGTMVAQLYQAADKWNVTVIDMFSDKQFQEIPTQEQRSLWMADKIHPTRAGYRDWWLAKFEDALVP